MKKIAASALLSIILGFVPAQGWDKVEIKTTALGDNVYMIQARGGNIAVHTGEDGLFVIDDQYAPLSNRLLAEIGKLSKQKVSWVINTHWHGDHTGGNENFGATGAVIVAHDNVRLRMSTDQFMKALNREVPASPEAALPVITFSDSATFHINGDTLKVFHVADAHTDGDAVVYMQQANVIHMGDTWFHTFYPFIDIDSGGHINGMIASAERALALADDDTRIIPGHGPLGNKADLEKYLQFLVTTRDRVAEAVKSGKTLEETQQMPITKEWEEEWGQGWIKKPRYIEFVYHCV